MVFLMCEQQRSLAELISFFKLERWDELRQQDYKLLENELGKFKTLYIHDCSAFTIREYVFECKEDILYSSETGRSDQVEISFFFNQEMLTDRINGKQNTYLPYHSYVYYTPSKATIEIDFRKAYEYRNLDIYVSLDFFNEWAAIHAGVDNFQEKIRANEFVRLFPSGLPINAKVLAVLLAIKSCEYIGIIRCLFIKAKILELLSVLFDLSKEYDRPAKRFQNVLLRKHELDAIFQVKAFLETYAEQFYTIEFLSKKFNINVFKLKKGFREVVGAGLFEYANQWRMDRAMKLIKSSDYSIKEIAFRIGYSGLSSFSASFKKVFGVSPNRLRK